MRASRDVHVRHKLRTYRTHSQPIMGIKGHPLYAGSRGSSSAVFKDKLYTYNTHSQPIVGINQY